MTTPDNNNKVTSMIPLFIGLERNLASTGLQLLQRTAFSSQSKWDSSRLTPLPGDLTPSSGHHWPSYPPSHTQALFYVLVSNGEDHTHS